MKKSPSPAIVEKTILTVEGFEEAQVSLPGTNAQCNLQGQIPSRTQKARSPNTAIIKALSRGFIPDAACFMKPWLLCNIFHFIFFSESN